MEGRSFSGGDAGGKVLGDPQALKQPRGSRRRFQKPQEEPKFQRSDPTEPSGGSQTLPRGGRAAVGAKNEIHLRAKKSLFPFFSPVKCTKIESLMSFWDDFSRGSRGMLRSHQDTAPGRGWGQTGLVRDFLSPFPSLSSPIPAPQNPKSSFWHRRSGPIPAPAVPVFPAVSAAL